MLLNVLKTLSGAPRADIGLRGAPQADNYDNDEERADDGLRGAPRAGNGLLWLQWMVGRRGSVQLHRTCPEMNNMLCGSRFRFDCWILHDDHVFPFSCAHYADVHWMFFTLHLTADNPPTEDETVIVLCPSCQQPFRYYMYAAVRYRASHLELDGSIMIKSELRCIRARR